MSATTTSQSLATLLFFFLTSIVQASELDELATTQRQLDQVQLSLDRARTVAAQSDPNNRRRYLFDYKKANEDLNTMRAGIDRYTQPSHAQPLDYGKEHGRASSRERV